MKQRILPTDIDKTTYKQFMDKKKKYKTKMCLNIIIAYFEKLCKARKTFTLWSINSWY